MRVSRVVSLVAVLEHLVEPGAALHEIIDLLAPNGILYLLVPDANRFRDHIDAPYQEFSVEHINYFTSASLRNLLLSDRSGCGGRADVPRAVESMTRKAPPSRCCVAEASSPSEIRIDSVGVDDLRSIHRPEALRDGSRGPADDRDAGRRPEPDLRVGNRHECAATCLPRPRLAECNIVAFLDSNPHYAGQQLAGRPVKAPRDVARPWRHRSSLLRPSAKRPSRTRRDSLFGPDVPLILMY